MGFAQCTGEQCSPLQLLYYKNVKSAINLHNVSFLHWNKQHEIPIFNIIKASKSCLDHSEQSKEAFRDTSISICMTKNFLTDLKTFLFYIRIEICVEIKGV